MAHRASQAGGSAIIDEEALQGEETQTTRLTKNEQLVLNVLREAGGPLKAYELLAALKDQGVKAPMTVYRALDRLEHRGLIHKLDTLNAFVICNHATPHPLEMFLVCKDCNKAVELEETEITRLDWPTLKSVAEAEGFVASSVRVEIRGTCKTCR